MPCKPSSNNTRRRISFRRTSALLPILSIGKWSGGPGIHYDEACSSHAKCYLLLLGVSLTAPILFSELTTPEFGHAAKSAAQSNKLAKQERCKDKHKSPLCAAMGKKEKKMRMVKKLKRSEWGFLLEWPLSSANTRSAHTQVYTALAMSICKQSKLYICRSCQSWPRWISNTPRHRPRGFDLQPSLAFLASSYIREQGTYNFINWIRSSFDFEVEECRIFTLEFNLH